MKQTAALLLLALVPDLTLAKEFHVSPNGDDSHNGAKSSPFKTISAAAQVAQPGDVITVHQGIYRERITPPRGGTSDKKRIVYQAASGEKVEIKGSEVVKGWVKVQLVPPLQPAVEPNEKKPPPPLIVAEETVSRPREVVAVLVMAMLWLLVAPSLTMPKATSETAMSAVVPTPVRATVFIGVTGSSLRMVIVAACAPAVEGSNWTVTVVLLPAAMVSGKPGEGWSE